MNVTCVYQSGFRSLWIACLTFACLANATRAQAEAPRVLVMASRAKANPQEAQVIDVVRDTLSARDGVQLLPPPALDLEGVQLALDCSDDSARCLGEVATRMQADILILPRLEQSKDGLELRITRYERGSVEAPAVAMRKQAGALLDDATLEAVPAMLDELLAVEEEEPLIEALQPREEPEESPAPAAPDSEARTGLPLGPVLLGGGAVLLLTAGVVVGAIASATEDEYASRVIDTPEKADAALVLRQNGKDQAFIANVLLINGAAALVGAGVWYVLVGGYGEAPEARASVRPYVGAQGAGLVLSGAWEARR